MIHRTALGTIITAVIASGALGLDRAFAEELDIAVYGGSTINNQDLLGESTRSNSIAISVGLGAPDFLGETAKIRADASYLFGSFSYPTFTPDFNNPGQFLPITQSVDSDRLFLHVGPVWSTPKILGRLTLSAGAQVGVEYWEADYAHDLIQASPIPIPPPGAIYINRGSEFSDLRFSYQIPVSADFELTDRFSISARYRAIGNQPGQKDFEHVLEAGFRFKF